MYSVIQEDDGTFAFHLHVPPRQLDPERAREILLVLRPVLDELARACEPASPTAPPISSMRPALPGADTARRARRAAERAFRSRYPAGREGTPLSASVAAAPDGWGKRPRRRAARPARD